VAVYVAKREEEWWERGVGNIEKVVVRNSEIRWDCFRENIYPTPRLSLLFPRVRERERERAREGEGRVQRCLNAGVWELKLYVFVAELFVHCSKCIPLFVQRTHFLCVQVHFHGSAAILAYTGSFSDNLGWEANVFKNSLVNVCQSTGSRTSLVSLLTNITPGKDDSLSNEDNVVTAELFCQFSGQSNLKLLEFLSKYVRNKNHKSSFVVVDFDVYTLRKLESFEFCFHVRGRFKVKEDFSKLLVLFGRFMAGLPYFLFILRAFRHWCWG